MCCPNRFLRRCLNREPTETADRSLRRQPLPPSLDCQRARRASKQTARMITPPVMIRLVASCTPTCASPVCKTSMISTPKNVASTDPRPPIRLVPPITQAAIAESSNPIAALGSAVPSRDVCISAATPHNRPLIANTANRYGRSRIPDNRTAS